MAIRSAEIGINIQTQLVQPDIEQAVKVRKMQEIETEIREQIKPNTQGEREERE